MLKRKSFLFSLLCAFVLCSIQSVFAQTTTKINLTLSDSSLKNLIQEIESQTDYTFVYDNTISLTQKISVTAVNETIQIVLNKAFTGKPISYEITGRQIILKQKEDSKNKKISGKITDQKGEPLIGAFAVISGTKNGSSADLEGNFSIATEQSNVVLEVSYLGFITQKVTVGNRNFVEIKLQEDYRLLDEVVLVGYGTQRKRDLTSSISILSNKEITNQTLPNAAAAMQGRLPGVQINVNGAPGSSPAIRIRGTGSINNTGPLYVVDGVMVDDISYLSTGDIDNMTVLKDASASAIYGVRAANGVILVSTKRGTTGGKVTVSINSYAGYKQVSNLLEKTNTAEYITMFNELMDYNNTAVQKLNPANFTTNTVWLKEVLRSSWTNNQDISINGGSDKTSFSLGINHLTDNGLIKDNAFGRYSVRSQYDINFNKNIKTGISLVMSSMVSRPYPGDLLWRAFQAVPMLTPVNSDGTYGDPSKIGTWSPPDNNRNPAAMLKYNNQWNNSVKAVGNMFLDITFLKYFNFRTTFGLNPTFTKSLVFNPKYAVGTSVQKNDKNTISKSVSDYLATSWDNTLSFERSLKGGHNIKAMLGYSYREQSSNYLNAGADNIVDIPEISQNFLFLTIGKGTGYVVNATDGGGKNVQIGFLGRLSYDYKHKYLLNATMRADGSSKFPKNNRWGYFPSVGLGWVASEEDFIQELDVFDMLKVRAGWGLLGNDNIPSNIYNPVVSNGTLVIFGPTQNTGTGTINPSSTINKVFNANLLWERVNETNVGLDVMMLKKRFSASLDWYYKLTEDAVFPITIIGSSGLTGSGVWGNYATILNTGFELSLSWQDKIGELEYFVNANGTYNRNEVKEISASGAAYIDAGDDGNNIKPFSRTTVGRPVGEFFGYKAIGVFQNQAEIDAYPHMTNTIPGVLKYEDVNSDGVIDAKDRTRMGNPNPPFLYGFGFGLNYKNFDMNIFCQGVYGNKIFNENRMLMTMTTNFDKAFYDNRWHGEGTSNTYPSSKVTAGDSRTISSFYVEDGSYFRIKSFQLGYTFPSKILSKLSVSSLRLYLNAENPLTVFKYNGFSPEVPSTNPLLTGINNGVYPLSSVYSVGLNLTF